MVAISLRLIVVISFLVLLLVPAIGDESQKFKLTVKPVISPYRNLHQDDLVQWRTWDKDTLQLARTSGKLILLSSGYYACHYCHVMKRESFENTEIAAFINSHFIPVLIDRELHPTLDGQLLRFMEVIGAPQGWPLTVVLTSEGYPLAGTLYRPASSFLEFLQQIQTNWKNNRSDLEQIALQASQEIIAQATVPAVIIENQQQQHQIRYAFIQQTRLVADKQYGGFGNGAKYPLSPQLLALLQLQISQPSSWLEAHIRRTLYNMADYGLYDHLDGGFFRYTTDRQWQSPHYEKMLYDNAQLALVYLEAARILDEPAFLSIATKTLDFMLHAMSATNGGFIASLSAEDEHGNNGGYYHWTASELESLLEPQEWQLVKHLWHVIEINDRQLYLPGKISTNDAKLAELSKKLGLTRLQAQQAVQSTLDKTRLARQARRVLRDEKRLAGWNGLALLAFTRAARYSGSSRYQKTASQQFQFINSQLWDGETLRRIPGGGNSGLADYAYIAAGLLEYAQLTSNEAHYRICAAVAEQAWQRFYIDGFWRSSENLELLLPYTVYPVSMPDTELPSPAATLIAVSLQLGSYLDKRYTEYASKAQQTIDGNLLKSPFFHATQITGWQTTDAINKLH